MAQQPQRKGFFRSMVDFSTWMGTDSIKANGQAIGTIFERVRNYTPSGRVETFDEAMKRLGLDEEALNKRKRQCLLSGWLFVAFSLSLFVYSFSLLLHDHLVSFFIAFLLALIAGLTAYREGFWYYQMTKRKLGCSHKEFFMYITGRK